MLQLIHKAEPPLEPYVSNAPKPATSTTLFLREVFGKEFPPLGDVYNAIFGPSRKPPVTIYPVHALQFQKIWQHLRLSQERAVYRKLINKIRQAPSRQWMYDFFELAIRLIRALNLLDYDPRLIANIGGKKRITYDINHLYVLIAFSDWGRNEERAIPNIDKNENYCHFDLLLPAGLKEQLKLVPNVLRIEPISSKSSHEKHIWVRFLVKSPLELSEDIISAWENLAKRELNRSSGSLIWKKEHHKTVVYAAATDLNFRKALLDEAFGKIE